MGAVDTLREDSKGKPAEFSDEVESVCVRKMNESRKTPRLLSCATRRVAESRVDRNGASGRRAGFGGRSRC